MIGDKVNYLQASPKGIVVAALQPSLPLFLLQSVEAKVVDDCEPAMSTTHPEDVCSVIALVAPRLTPSRMSISPELGQLGPKSQ